MQSALDKRLRGNGLRRGESLAQIRASRIRRLAQAKPTALVSLADEQELFDTFRPAKCVELLEQIQHGRRLEFKRGVREQMQLARERGKRGIVRG